MVVSGVSFILLAFLTLPAKWRSLVSAKTSTAKQQLAEARELRHDRQEQMIAAFNASEKQNVRQSLTTLMTLDEPGALKIWQAALKTADPELQREAWAEYQRVRLKLERKEFIPQIARCKASASDITEIAGLAGLDVNVWVSTDNTTLIAAAPYLVDELRRAGIGVEIIYDSIA